MKLISMMLALILSLNSVAWADPESVVLTEGAASTISATREAELFDIAQDNPAEVLRHMTDAELLQVAHDLKILIQDIQKDFSTPDAYKDGKLGFTIHEWSKVSIPLAVALTAIGILSRTKAFKNSPDNPATYLVILILGVGVAAAISAGNDKMVWVTTAEAQIIQEKIMRLRKLSLLIDRHLK